MEDLKAAQDAVAESIKFVFKDGKDSSQVPLLHSFIIWNINSYSNCFLFRTSMQLYCGYSSISNSVLAWKIR